jgi:hypothetical protein
LLDPFIQKSKGPALVSEFVANSLEEIERYRLHQFDEEEPIEVAAVAGNSQSNTVDKGLHTYVKGTVADQMGTIRQNKMLSSVKKAQPQAAA